MLKYGQVIAYNSARGIATIRYARPEACEKCGACSTGREETIDLPAVCEKGDWVSVELPEGKFLSAAAFAYVVPLVCFLAAFLAGHFILGTDGAAALFALGGLAIGFLLVFFIGKFIARRPDWSPRVTAVYKQRPEEAVLSCSSAPQQ